MNRRRTRRTLVATVLGTLTAGGLAARCFFPADAEAQRVDPRRPATFVVGTPSGPSPMQRVDAQRRGATTDPFANGPLRTVWRKTIGLSLEQPVLAGADGSIAVVTARGDVIFLDTDGEEIAKVGTGANASSGPAAITSDGTVVFTTSAGDAVGVRRSSTQPRFFSRIGGERNPRAAPVSLADGGVVVATMSDLVVLDAEGGVRARVTLPESPAAPLLARGESILAITATGAVYAWIPGREPTPIGSFGARPDGGAALADSNTLVGVVQGQQLVELNLTTGARSTRALAAGAYLGPPSIHRPSAGPALASLVKVMPNLQCFVSSFDPSGHETQSAPIATLTLPALPDGGAASPSTVPRDETGVLVDGRGAIVFAAPDGIVGLVTAEGAITTIGERICSQSRRSAGISGLTPLGRGSFAVTCEGGVVARVDTGDGGAARRSSPAKVRTLPVGPAGSASSTRPGAAPTLLGPIDEE